MNKYLKLDPNNYNNNNNQDEPDIKLMSYSFIFWNVFLSFVQCNITQSAIITVNDIRPKPAPMVNINGTMLNLPPVPDTFIIILRP